MVAELVDAHDSKSCSARSVGSIPTHGTKSDTLFHMRNYFIFCVTIFGLAACSKPNVRDVIIYPQGERTYTEKSDVVLSEDSKTSAFIAFDGEYELKWEGDIGYEVRKGSFYDVTCDESTQQCRQYPSHFRDPFIREPLPIPLLIPNTNELVYFTFTSRAMTRLVAGSNFGPLHTRTSPPIQDLKINPAGTITYSYWEFDEKGRTVQEKNKWFEVTCDFSLRCDERPIVKQMQ